MSKEDPEPPMVEEDVMKFASGDDDASLGDISASEPYKRRSTKNSIVLPNGGTREPICKPWTEFTELIHSGMTKFVLLISTHAAQHPIAYIVGCSALAFGMVIVGFFTNFKLELDFEKVFTPLGSAPAEVRKILTMVYYYYYLCIFTLFPFNFSALCLD